MTPSERARHAANVRYGKENPFAARLAALRTKRKAKGKKPAVNKAAQQQANQDKVFTAMQIGDEAASTLLSLAAGELGAGDDFGLIDKGLAERDADGNLRFSAHGRAFMNAANSGNPGAARDALSRGRDAASAARARTEKQGAKEKAKQEKEEKPKAGGGGGGKKKPEKEDKDKERSAEREKTAAATAGKVGLKPADVSNLRAAAEGGELTGDVGELARLGLIEQGETTDQGRRALLALERGDVRQYRAALQDASARMEREGAARTRKDEREKASAERDKERAQTRTERAARQAERAKDRADRVARQALRDKEHAEDRARRLAKKDMDMDDPAIKQSAEQRAMFANMGSSGGGSGGGGGSKPTGGQGGLWKEGPSGKRTPQAGLEKPKPKVKTRADKQKQRKIKKELGDLEAERRYIQSAPHRAKDPMYQARLKKIDARAQELRAAKGIDMSDLLPVLDDLEAIYTEALELSEEAEIKAGRRNNTTDQAQIDRGYELAMDLCDLFEALGASTGEEEGEEDDADMEDMEGKAQRTFGGKKRDDLDDADFAGPDRSFPIMTAQDVRDAAKLIGKADDPEAVKRKIIAIAKRKGFADAIPEAWQATKKDAEEFIMGDAIKSLADGAIGAFAVRFGSESQPDMSQMRDYFTKSTDFWLDAWDRRPMLYHHALDEDTSDAPRIGTWTKAEVKDEGVWLEGQLDKSHRYYGAIKELIRRGVLRLSSDSAPHLVRRAVKGSTHEVTRWPLLAASLTPTPAEPRLTAVSFKALLAEYGLEAIQNDSPEAPQDEGERSDGTQAQSDRARRLLLRSRLLQLQE
jgi:hypothetical protein